MKLLAVILSLLQTTAFCQLPDSLRDKVRNATDEYVIRYDTVSITGSKTLPCLNVRINGKAFKFLIDLGSNVTIFKQSVAEQANMDMVFDRARGAIVKAAKLEIGNSVFSNVHGGTYKDLDVDGVIGFNLFKKANFVLDYPNMLFAFIDKDPVKTDSTYVKYETIGRMPYLKSVIAGKTLYINFDTGASLWLYLPLNMKDSVALQSPVKEFRNLTNNQTGTTMTYVGQLKDDVSFGNYTISSPNVVFDPAIEDAFVGSSLLNQFKLFFYPKLELVQMIRKEKGKLIIIPKEQKKNN